ncbi:hypothetical protein BVG16_28580 [Paenibacillus selenitireducens]|uniref:YxiS n=1 Tax=Paenibacillus selenitireducens TaxID=1324314 RepID=A0A1T2X0N3_9BACL|nr:hypothetical protein [Paenibacillus selenitireducens]OPA73430.1 hypothetical protein BVG16_28580 [Paenibacillus selenitireducens]
MNNNELERQMIEQFQRDERMMILVFAQWCINNGLDPEVLYLKAYPQQVDNVELREALKLTVSKEEAGPIAEEIVLGMLAAYNNDDLACVVTEEIERMKQQQK